MCDLPIWPILYVASYGSSISNTDSVFDEHFKRSPGSNKYFMTTFVAYILGLAGTIVVMHVFKHAQPALLYLVPACLGAPFLVALVTGEMKERLYHMITYSTNNQNSEEKNSGTDLGSKYPEMSYNDIFERTSEILIFPESTLCIQLK